MIATYVIGGEELEKIKTRTAFLDNGEITFGDYNLIQYDNYSIFEVDYLKSISD